MRRWLRCLVCLLLICALLINLSPIKAEATAAGAVGIAKASLVTGNPAIIVGAALLAVGVTAGVESGAFENLIDNAVSYLDSAGGWIENGTMQLLQSVTEAGQTAYYVAGDLLETLRSWLFESDVLQDISSTTQTLTFNGTEYLFTCDVPFVALRWDCNGQGFYAFVSASKGTLTYDTSTISISRSANDLGSFNGYYLSGASGSFVLSGDYSGFYYLGDFTDHSYFASRGNGYSYQYVCKNYVPSLLGVPVASSDLTLGNVSSVPIDGTSARTWAPDVADRNGLYVKYNNDPEPPDDNNGNWFWRLALPLTILELIAMSQVDEWTGETPEEFPTGDTVTEFEILDRPEIDGYQGIEVSPVTDPNPDTDPDTEPDTNPDTDPDAGTDTGTDTGADAWQPSEMGNFVLDLKNYFPFCIPFDIYDFLTCLNADPVAPVIDWEIPLPGGSTYPMQVDLSAFDDVARLLRRLQLLLFCVGLAAKTRDLIKG